LKKNDNLFGGLKKVRTFAADKKNWSMRNFFTTYYYFYFYALG